MKPARLFRSFGELHHRIQTYLFHIRVSCWSSHPRRMSAPPSYQASVRQDDRPVISFTLNGESVTIDPNTSTNVSPHTTLAEYLRTTKWTGTKISCAEGGCGACTVAMTFTDPVSGSASTRAINSCLRPLFSCNGTAITTNDGIGTPSNPHPIQEALAHANGSQCGFCSNGMVMTLYALMSENSSLTQLEIERQYDGNLCRCTGYRQILHAMKQFATDSEPSCIETGCKRRGLFPDIEEVEKHLDAPPSVKNYKHRSPKLHVKTASSLSKLSVSSGGNIWQDCPTLDDLDFWLPWYTSNGQNPMLVVAQTSLGVYPRDVPVKLNISGIPELTNITQDNNGITIGAACPIVDVITYFTSCTTSPSYRTAHLAQAAKHLGRVASSLIRNIASIAGNIFLCHAHQSADDFFCSDIATVLMGLGATVTYKNPGTDTENTVSMTDFFTTDFTGCYAKHIKVPWALENEVFMSYKIALRQVNSHAIVNSAMRAVVDPTTNKITAQPTIVYGGIFAKPTRITAVENALNGVDVTDNTKFQSIATTLQSALVPVSFEGRQAFRKSVATCQFYKFNLFLQPSLPTDLQSAVSPWFERGVTSGSTAFTPDPAMFPVDIGMTKVEAIEQTTGHAKYTDDLASTIDTAYAHLVLTQQGNCTLNGIDTSVAASKSGFIKFIQASDLPSGANAWQDGPIFQEVGQLIPFAGKCCGVVIATTAEYAKACARAVVLSYGTLSNSIVDIADAVSKGSLYPAAMVPPVVCGDATAALNTAKHKYTGTAEIGYQYHFHLENHSSFVVPREDVFEVHCATQAPPLVQQQISATLGVPQSKVIVSTKRCGGGFGGKISNSVLPATICAFAAKSLSRPVKLVVPLDDSMQLLGCRGGRLMNYTVGFEDDGTITALQATVYCAGGATPYGGIGGAIVTINNLDNCYKIANFNVSALLANMNLPGITACRGPGWVPAVQLCEMVISRVASELSMTPEAVREKNFFQRGQHTADGMQLRFWNIPTIWSQLKESSEYETRKTSVATFNSNNRWKKRGLAMMPCRFAVGQAGANFDTLINIYTDGTVGVTIGGSEIGQGINTKVIQIVAKKLGMTEADLGMITVNETCTRSLSSANNVTGGSITSELCGLSAMHACETINARLAPFRQASQTWSALVSAASNAGVQLTATGWTNAPPAPSGGFNYNSTSAAVGEVEIDVLSGEFEVRRVDILFDCGISLNPVIDIGQVQGGFVMGMGYFVQEDAKWDPTTGRGMDTSTWTYKPPCAFDVPEKFNVTLLANSPNPLGVLSSKASGEPGVCLGAVVTQALEDAISEARKASGVTKRWVCEKTPLTVPDVQQACNPTVSEFTF